MALIVNGRGLISVDTGITWGSSAFSVPTVACYTNDYYGADYVSSIQPVNPNATYLDAPTMGDIDMEKMKEEMAKKFS